MLYNWTQININVSLKDNLREFSQKNSPYDLSDVIDEAWVKDAIARKYFVENHSQDSSLDSGENSQEFIG